MEWFKDKCSIPTGGKGLYPFTETVAQKIRGWEIQEGMCFLFLEHTSASLLISESYDPSATTGTRIPTLDDPYSGRRG
jgi:thiamine phosphate synthase YjbQ (UPF0047 family)